MDLSNLLDNRSLYAFLMKKARTRQSGDTSADNEDVTGILNRHVWEKASGIQK